METNEKLDYDRMEKEGCYFWAKAKPIKIDPVLLSVFLHVPVELAAEIADRDET